VMAFIRFRSSHKHLSSGLIHVPMKNQQPTQLHTIV
jgi:hypothetical protein